MHQDDKQLTTSQGKDVEQYTEDRYQPEDTISLLDLVAVLARHWRLIFFSTLFAAISIVGFSLYTIRLGNDNPNNPLPNVFTPEAQILLQLPSEGGLSSGLSSSELSLAAALGGGSGGTSISALAQNLLIGNELVDQIVDKFDIIDKNNYTEFPQTNAREFIRGSMEVNYEAETGVMTIGFTNTDKEFATEVLSSIVSQLEQRFKGITLKQIRNKKTFLENRLEQAGRELEEAQESMASFQREYGIYDLDAQSRQTIDKIIDATNQVYAKEVEIQNLAEYLPQDAPQIVRLRNDIELLKKLINELRFGFEDLPAMAIPQTRIAELSNQYLRLKTDLEIKRNAFVNFRQQYEQVRIEEMDNSKTFQILEEPVVPEMKSGPSRGTLAVIVTAATFFLAVLLAFLIEYFRGVKRDPEESKKWEEIKGMFRFRRR